jgi:hypothetical protein
MFQHVLEKMRAADYSFPAYLTKQAADYTPSHYSQASCADVFLSALKVHCSDEPVTIKAGRLQTVKEAAMRYGISGDIADLEKWLVQRERESCCNSMKTAEDWYTAVDWMRKNEEQLTAPQKKQAADYLVSVYPALDFVPGKQEILYLEKNAGTDTLTKLHKEAEESRAFELVTGTSYRNDQFRNLPIESLQTVLPQLLKSACCGLPAIQPDLLAKSAELLSPDEAYTLDKLFESCGEQPVRVQRPKTITVTDEQLSNL